MQREETGKLTIESVRSFIYGEPTKVQRLKWIDASWVDDVKGGCDE